MNQGLSIRARFLVDFLDLPAATGQDGARWEHFQLAHLNDENDLRVESKARQIAWSWVTAAEGLAEAVLGVRDSIYVSVNQDEAKEKIRYAKAVYNSLTPPAGFALPKIIRDNELGLEFDNGLRLRSYPSKAPRGRSGANIYLDEFAHAQHDRRIYSGSMPIISKGGRVRIGSSPFGESGMFWEVFTERMRAYPGFTRKTTPWYHTYAFCRDIPKAIKSSKRLSTEDLVYGFGNDRIILIYENTPHEDFDQEYCALFFDAASSWITWDELRGIQREDLACLFAEAKEKEVYKAKEAIDALAEMIRLGDCEKSIAVGVDVGRTRDLTEIYAVGNKEDGTNPLRFGLSISNMEFQDQEEILLYALANLPIASMLIDRNGIGMQLAENVSKANPVVAQGVNFTNGSKVVWATLVKTMTQKKQALIPVNRDLLYQIHSIKRLVTPSKNLVFDTARNEKHHADKFWAWALALHGFNSGKAPVTPVVFAQTYMGRGRYGDSGESELRPQTLSIDALKDYYQS